MVQACTVAILSTSRATDRSALKSTRKNKNKLEKLFQEMSGTLARETGRVSSE